MKSFIPILSAALIAVTPHLQAQDASSVDIADTNAAESDAREQVEEAKKDLQKQVDIAEEQVKENQAQADKQLKEAQKQIEKSRDALQKTRAGSSGFGGGTGGGGSGFGAGGYSIPPRSRYVFRSSAFITSDNSQNTPLIVRSSITDSKTQANLSEDMTVMRRILEKAMDENESSEKNTYTAMGIDVFFSPGSCSQKSLYIEGRKRKKKRRMIETSSKNDVRNR